jgi:predicted transcriptional regulator
VQVAIMASEQSNRFNVLLDDEHAERLHRLAERTYLNPGTLARSLLSTALDQADPDPATITALLDAIPGAWERAQEGVADVAAGRVIPLEAL